MGDPKSPEFTKALWELRARALAEVPDLDAQLKNAFDPGYWRNLNPAAAVGGSEPAQASESAGLDLSIVERPLQMLSTFGYFQTSPIVAGPAVERMRRCFEVTRNAGWHPVFVFVYDDFWWAFRGPALVRFLTAALGEGYVQLPYVWGHYVPANSSGWRPHVDGPSALKKLTVWLALNDATLDNGCMYVVPRNADTEGTSDRFHETDSFKRADILKLFQNIKALPAVAGSYLGWGAYLIHWGSTSGPLAVPRISISVEFACRPPDSPDKKPRFVEAHPAAPLPSLDTRLRFIAKVIKNYEYFDAGVVRHLALAERIISRTRIESAGQGPADGLPNE